MEDVCVCLETGGLGEEECGKNEVRDGRYVCALKQEVQEMGECGKDEVRDGRCVCLETGGLGEGEW